MSKRVFITGSAGFTGKYVCDEFRRAGWEVWGAGLQPKPDDAQYLQIDLLEPDTLKPIADKIKPDVVIHLAAIAFVAEKDPNIFYQVNLMGTRNLLEVLANARGRPVHDFGKLSKRIRQFGFGGAGGLAGQSG